MLCGSLSRRLHESPGQDRGKTGPGHPQFLWPCGLCPRGRAAETENGMTEAVPFPEKTILLSYDPAVFRRGEKKDAMFLNVSLGGGGFDLGLDLLGSHNAAEHFRPEIEHSAVPVVRRAAAVVVGADTVGDGNDIVVFVVCLADGSRRCQGL